MYKAIVIYFKSYFDKCLNKFTKVP